MLRLAVRICARFVFVSDGRITGQRGQVEGGKWEGNARLENANVGSAAVDALGDQVAGGVVFFAVYRGGELGDEFLDLMTTPTSVVLPPLMICGVELLKMLASYPIELIWLRVEDGEDVDFGHGCC